MRLALIFHYCIVQIPEEPNPVHHFPAVPSHMHFPAQFLLSFSLGRALDIQSNDILYHLTQPFPGRAIFQARLESSEPIVYVVPDRMPSGIQHRTETDRFERCSLSHPHSPHKSRHRCPLKKQFLCLFPALQT